MTDRVPPGSIEPFEALGGCSPTQPRPSDYERSFGTPLLFDLTLLQEEREEHPRPPTVYYLAAMVPSPQRVSPWRTVAGFGGVILAGLGLGLLLAVLLL
jgi:hypothetical protein